MTAPLVDILPSFGRLANTFLPGVRHFTMITGLCIHERREIRISFLTTAISGRVAAQRVVTAGVARIAVAKMEAAQPHMDNGPRALRNAEGST
jgi:hypothetical protein